MPSLVSVVFCQVHVSAKGRSLIQSSPTECGVSEFDRQASAMRNPRHMAVGCRAIKTIYRLINNWVFLPFFASHFFCCAGRSLL
jgi:hypothetical protein